MPAIHNGLMIAALLAVLSLAGASPMHAGGVVWTGLGPWTGSVQSIVVDPEIPNTLYASGYGAYKSTDGGAYWRNLPNGSGGKFRIGPGVVYDLTGSLLTSTDGGASWRSACWASLPPGGIDSIRDLAIAPSSPNTLYTYSESVFSFRDYTRFSYWLVKSTDGGANCFTVREWGGQAAQPLTAMAVDPQAPATVYVGFYDPPRIAKSTDSGLTWTEAPIPARPYGIYIDPLNPTTLYAVTIQGVFKSVDGAGSWNPAGAGLGAAGVNGLLIDPLTPATLYAAADLGVFKSIDGAGQWSAAGTGLGGAAVNELALDPLTPTMLYAATEGGAFKSVDGAGHWSPAAAMGLYASNVTTLAIDPGSATRYTGTDQGMFKNVGQPDRWSAANTGLNGARVNTVTIDPHSPTTLYAGTDTGVFKSTNGAGLWSPASAGLRGGVTALAIDPLHPTTLYIANYDGIFKSVDGTEHWTWAGAGLPNTLVKALAIDPLTPATLYAGLDPLDLSDPVLFKSTDGGEHWSAASTGLTNPWILALAVDPRSPTTLYVATHWGIFKSTDGAEHWSLNNPELPHVQALAIDPDQPAIIYAAAYSDIYSSFDAGGVWEPVDVGGLPTDGGLPPRINALIITASTGQMRGNSRAVYAGTRAGLFVTQVWPSTVLRTWLPFIGNHTP
jgi:hypothetical protein